MKDKAAKTLVLLFTILLFVSVSLAAYLFTAHLQITGEIVGDPLELLSNDKMHKPICIDMKIPRTGGWGEYFWLVSNVNETTDMVWNYTAYPNEVTIDIQLFDGSAWINWHPNEKLTFQPFEEKHIHLILMTNNATLGRFQVDIYFNQLKLEVKGFD